VLGHDQDQAGGGLDQNQAPNVIFDGLRIHSTMLTPSWIRAISMGSNPTSFGTTLWSNWCVSTLLTTLSCPLLADTKPSCVLYVTQHNVISRSCHHHVVSCGETMRMGGAMQ